MSKFLFNGVFKFAGFCAVNCMNRGADSLGEVPSQDEELKELVTLREQGYFDKHLGIRILIALLLVFCLFLFLHFREVRVEILELNSIAPKYVVAQVDFAFPDAELTLLLKQEAAKDIGKIYKIKEKDIQERRVEFEKYLIHNPSWRRIAEQSTFQEMYKAVDLLEQALMQTRFTDPRTIQKIKEMHLSDKDYQLFTPNGDLTRPVFLPVDFWTHLQTLAFAEHLFQSGTVDFPLNYFKNKSWKLEEDITAQRYLQKLAQDLVPEKFTKVSAGSRVIDQGEKVTSRHLAMMQAMKQTLGDQRNLWHPLTLLGSFILAAVFVIVGGFYLKMNHPDIYGSNKRLFLLVVIILITLVLSKAAEFFLLKSTTNLLDLVRFPLLVPFAAIMLCSLMNVRVAIFTSGFLTLVLSLGLAFDGSGFFLMNLIPSIVAALSMYALHKRKEVFMVCVKAWLSSLAIVVGLELYETGELSKVIVSDFLSTLVFMGFTGILVVGFLPLLESVFLVMTDITLMEYMDPSNDLLRRLSIEAPGTYQHSIVVGNLAEAAALAIDANGLFCRVSTQYHDIGKLCAPQYFTENQQGGVNMHQLLTPLESAQVIMSHVSEGVAMARKAGLPEQFISIIKEHHGTTLVYYFYRKQAELMGGDSSLVDEMEFRYMGPKPRTKESAIIMIADSLEAASRSLDEFTYEAVSTLVESLIAEKNEDGQFDECQLTFEELGIVKKTLIKTLVAAGHSRVKYPSKGI